jgi:type IV pilus assembly protein PilQ
MTKRRTTSICLAVFYIFSIFLSPVGAGIASAAGSNFTLKNRDIDVRDVCQMIARAAKINVVFSKDVHGKIAVELKDVPALEALKLVAKINKLYVHKVEGLKDTYAVARRADIEDEFLKGTNMVYTLKYAKASDMQGILSKALGKSTNINVEVDDRTNSLVVTGSDEVLEKIRELIKKLDRTVPQVLIDTKIVQVKSTVLEDLGFNWGWGTGGAADGVVAGDGGSGGLFAFTEAVAINPNQSYYDNAPTGAAPFFQFGDFFRANSFINAAFTALETNSLTRTLASPRLLAVNGEQARLRIGDKIVYTGGPSQPPETADTGIVLDVTPRINKDNFITMEISVEQSTATFQRPDFPTIAQTSAETTVQLKDGEEVLVAGLVAEDVNSSEVRIPFLSDIPILKHFFTHKSNKPITNELVLLVTPRVISQVPTSGSGFGEESGGGIFDDSPIGLDDIGSGNDGWKSNPKPNPKPKPVDDKKDPFADDDFDDSFDDDLDDL